MHKMFPAISGQSTVVTEDDLENYTWSQHEHTLWNIKKYNLKSAIFNTANSWKELKITTLANSWMQSQKLILRNLIPLTSNVCCSEQERLK